ncbi:hypothetical protein GCM10023194_53630 [Planotetraspora phitsanulokensis]|uniref:Uncharacterized protein n=1 Tax=Planotetraspora phitsanulokensis TaxID=575192 RepID=A0A8J3U288_9ACTN|nr:hypothetical protein [Planotetraspora phitsanulokensis]GII36617.1 hypothetical protein Pph01_16200 [Planotetraspora phitsanulokensis]
MSHPDTPVPQLSPPQPQATTTKPRAGNGLLATAILFAGIGGGLLAWHPWDKDPVQEPPSPQNITIQKVGEQRNAGDFDSSRPVYCMTNETGGLYCMVMPGRYTDIQQEPG